MRVSFDKDSKSTKKSLELWVAKFKPNGTFMSLGPLSTDLFLCPKTTQEQLDDFQKVGFNSKHACYFDMYDALNNTETLFYELFVRDINGNLIDVPVQINNLVTSNAFRVLAE